MADKKRILCVEDDQNLRRILTKWLKDYELIGYDNPDEAYEFAAGEAEAGRPLDLFLLDIALKVTVSMDEIDNWKYHKEPLRQGIHLAKELRCLPAYGESPMIVMSGLVDRKTIGQALPDELNVLFLSKPLTHDTLCRHLEEMLGTG